MAARRRVDSHRLIEGLLRHETFGVMAQAMGVRWNTVRSHVDRLRHTYCAIDRYELEYKLKQLLG